MSDGEVRPFLRKTYQNLFQISLDISPECFLTQKRQLQTFLFITVLTLFSTIS